jgi:hypothetical protein
MVITRTAPEFPDDAQRQLYDVRREFALMVKFPHDPEYEQEYIGAMTVERAEQLLAKTVTELNAYKQRMSKNSARRSAKGKAKTSAATVVAGTPVGDDPMNPGNDPTNPGDDVSRTASADEPATDEDPEQNESVIGSDPPDSSSSESDDDDDPRRRASKKDRRAVKGRTPRIDVKGKTSKKLFKMDPPEKYSGEKDKDRTYAAVHQFLGQLSRYLRLATNIDMDADIVKYVLGFLSGFAYDWFEAMDKGDTPFK